MSPSQVHEDKAPSRTEVRKSSACWSIVFSSVVIGLFCCLIQCNSSYFPTCILCLGFGTGTGIMHVCQTSGILPGQMIFHSRAAGASWLLERLIICRSVTAENQFTSSLHNITSFHFILCYLKKSTFFLTYFYISFIYLFICLFVFLSFLFIFMN